MLTNTVKQKLEAKGISAKPKLVKIKEKKGTKKTTFQLELEKLIEELELKKL
jgi:hypothetical protein